MEKSTHVAVTFLRFWQLKIKLLKNLKHKIFVDEIITFFCEKFDVTQTWDEFGVMQGKDFTFTEKTKHSLLVNLSFSCSQQDIRN